MIKFQPTNCSPSFNGLTSQFKKTLFNSHEQVRKIVNAYPEKNGIVGELPVALIKKITPDKAKEFFTDFSEVIKTLQQPNKKIEQKLELIEKSYDFKKTNPNKTIITFLNIFNKEANDKNAITNARKQLANISKKYNLNKIDLDFEGIGNFGRAYRINIENTDYALKIGMPHKYEPRNSNLMQYVKKEIYQTFDDEAVSHGVDIE
ncbi:MAG: hypothetical protein PHV68_07825, partial [Candidatus Gastranaerophilales bacterium]|nr:hypothetical protein [Candidatus Gastranaerophilales bacterium]